MKQRTPFRCIGASEFEILLRRHDALVLDVRDAENFRNGHVDGAQPVSMTNISTVLNGTAKSTPILIYCYRGHASREYAQVFSDFGFSEVYSLDGGYDAWRTRQKAARAAVLIGPLQQWLTERDFPADNVNAAIANGMTPLMRASQQGASDVIHQLVAAGANLHMRNVDGNTALWFACVGGHLAVIDMLIGFGADLDNRNDNAATALMYAASTGKAEVLERLLKQGADITLETLDGFSAIDMAATIECLNLLRHALRTLEKAKVRSGVS